MLQAGVGELRAARGDGAQETRGGEAGTARHRGQPLPGHHAGHQSLHVPS